MNRISYIACFASLVAFFVSHSGLSIADDEVTDVQRTAIEEILRDYLANHPQSIQSIIRDYIMANPQVILDSVERLRTTRGNDVRRRKLLKEMRSALENDLGSHVAGNPNGDVTVVEFFDYRCPYCRQLLAAIDEVMKNDPGIRIVFKELPILSRGSVLAAHAALAARYQNKDLYVPYHKALMNARGMLSKNRVLMIAADVGLDADLLARDMETPEIKLNAELVIQRNKEQAAALGIRGTPAIIVGDQIVTGAVDRERLRDLIATERHSKSSLKTDFKNQSE